MTFRPRHIDEKEFTAMQQRVSQAGVKEHTAVRGGGRGAATDRGNHDRTTVKSSARTLLATTPYRSKWEAAYANKLELEKHAGLVHAYWYEPMSLWLPGKVRYKPDFLVQYGDGPQRSLEMVEVKGWSKNRRDGITRMKIASAIFSCFTWRMVYRTAGGGWSGEYL